MERCKGCRAPLSEGATWCRVCFRRVLEIDPRELAEELTSTYRPRTRWERPAPEPRPEPAFSRIVAGPLSFGLAAKVTMTAALGAMLFLYLAGNAWSDIYAIVMGIPGVLGAVLLLRVIWRRERIR